MKNSETQVWLDFALACEYIERPIYEKLSQEVKEIGRLLNYMTMNPDKFGSKKL